MFQNYLLGHSFLTLLSEMCPLCHRTIVLWMARLVWLLFKWSFVHIWKSSISLSQRRRERRERGSSQPSPSSSQKPEVGRAPLRSRCVPSVGVPGPGPGLVVCEYWVLCNVTVCNQNSVFVTIANRQSSWTVFKEKYIWYKSRCWVATMMTCCVVTMNPALSTRCERYEWVT